MENLNYQGYLVVTFCITFTFLATEMQLSQNYGYYIFANVVTLIAVLILSQYNVPRWITLIIVASWIILILVCDLGLYATKKNYKTFYIPFLIEIVLLAIGVAVLYFRLPERFCKRVTFVEVYCNSSIIFAMFFVSFLFETQVILYYTIRANSGNLSDSNEWWKVRNVYT